MKITSQSIKNNQPINPKYTCDGEDISPQLSWSDYPQDTKSFALVCYDPDSPSGDFVHWMVANIPHSINEVKEEQMDIPEALNIENDFGKKEYGGPCPASGNHRYIFRVYALNIEKIDGVNKDNFYDTIKEYTIEQAEIMTTYQRKN